MKHLHSALGATVLALGMAAAFPATAQTSGNTTTYGTTPSAPAAPGTATQNSPTTGALPDNSLPGQRQGTIGGTVTQGGAQSGTSGSSGSSSGGAASSSSSSGTSGALPDNSLAGQRQGTMSGGAVTQGGAGSTEKPKQGSGQ